MGVATTAAPYGFWATNPTKKLAYWVYLLSQPLSRNRVFQNFSGEPPPLKGAGGGGGGLHRNSLEIDFIVVSDRGE